MGLKQKVTWLLIATISSFLALTAICTLVRPEIFDHPGYAISYFGSPGPAVLPYMLGFAIVVLCFVAIGRLVRDHSKFLSNLYFATAACIAGIMATSYPQQVWVFWVHMSICYVLAVVQLTGFNWIISKRSKERVRLQYIALEFVFVAGMVLGAMSSRWVNWYDTYYLGEVVMFIAGIWLLGLFTVRLVGEPTKKAPARPVRGRASLK